MYSETFSEPALYHFKTSLSCQPKLPNMSVSGKISTWSIHNMSCVGPKFHLDSAADRQPLSHCYMFHNLRSLESGERDRRIIHAVWIICYCFSMEHNDPLYMQPLVENDRPSPHLESTLMQCWIDVERCPLAHHTKKSRCFMNSRARHQIEKLKKIHRNFILRSYPDQLYSGVTFTWKGWCMRPPFVHDLKIIHHFMAWEWCWPEFQLALLVCLFLIYENVIISSIFSGHGSA